MTKEQRSTRIARAMLGCWVLWVLFVNWQMWSCQRQLTAMQKQVTAQQEQLDRLWVIDLGKLDREQGAAKS